MRMNLEERIGLDTPAQAYPDAKTLQYINLRLALLGCPTLGLGGEPGLPDVAGPLLSRHRETARLLANYLSPADWRIQSFLDEYFYDTNVKVRLPSQTFVLDTYGLARILSLPPDKDEFVSEIVRTYRVRQGILHNPSADRRTTQGVFHV